MSRHFSHFTTFVLVVVSFISPSFAQPTNQAPPRAWTSTPFDPPAIPLAVRSPYSNAWLPNGNGTALYDAWATNWDGKFTAWAGFVRVDGKPYRTMGIYISDSVEPAKQLRMEFAATSTIFVLRCGSVDFTYTFLSPADPSDLVRFSFPWSYLFISASSNDGVIHKVEIYSDITAEWINDDRDIAVEWNTRTTDPQGGNDDGLITHQIWQPALFSTNCTQTDNHRIQDGMVSFSAFNRQGLTFTTLDSETARQQFLGNGVLNNLRDQTFRTVGNNFPVFAFAHDLGQVLGKTDSVIFGVGLSRLNLVKYATGASQTQFRAPFYLTRFGNPDQAMDFFMRDYNHAMGVAAAMDSQLESDASAVSSNYATLLLLTFRQAVAGLELTAGRKLDGSIDANDVMMFTAEYGASRYRANSVDQIYNMMPFFLYLNPDFVKYAIRPVLQYHHAALSKTPYCVMNIGETYPQAIGPADEDIEMPVAASAEMIILAAVHLQRTKDTAVINDYYDILKQFADYLVENTLFPAEQYSMAETSIVPKAANITNLALQGIIALRAMTDLSNAHGDATNGAMYSTKATDYISQWKEYAMSADGKHLVFTYGNNDSYGMMHNVYPDLLLGYNIIPKDTLATQEAWYQAKHGDYGPIVYWSRGWTLAEPNLFVSATMQTPAMRDHMINGVVQQLQSGLSDQPMPDQFDAHYLSHYGFHGRPHVGAFFSLLAMQKKQINLAGSPADPGQPSAEDDASKDTAVRISIRNPNLFLLGLIVATWICV